MLGEEKKNKLQNKHYTHAHLTRFLVVVCWCGSVRVVVTATPLTAPSRLTACMQSTKGGASDRLGVPSLAGNEVALLSVG